MIAQFNFLPTYLYIKRHSITGKCYFGKTASKDPIKYLGSGLHWKRHIKKHGIEHVETLWYKLFNDQKECTRVALLFSEQQNIVKSDLWLNFIAENGLDSCLGLKRSQETCARISASHKGKIFSEEHKKKISISGLGRKNSPAHIEKTRQGHLGSKRSEETKAKIKEGTKFGMIKMKRKTWKLQDPNGNLIETQYLKDFCKKNHLGLSKILETEKTKIPVDNGFSKGWIIISTFYNDL